jgi:crotonobetainyl-CoA:carnitine CoA-transferase CaiB-like acyl-CoA transferase
MNNLTRLLGATGAVQATAPRRRTLQRVLLWCIDNLEFILLAALAVLAALAYRWAQQSIQTTDAMLRAAGL